MAGADGMMRIAVGLELIPDVSVILWDRLAGRKIPREPIPSLAADLAVEVLSVSNTAAEMALKITEYFAAGTASVWVVDPKPMTIRIYSSLDESTLLCGNDRVTDPLLPGFQMVVSDIFRRAGILDD